MSEQAPIDGFEFAREGRRLEGEMAVSALQRLHDVVVDTSGAVRYRIEGSIDTQRRPVLDVTVEATLPLTCQRCLERMDYELKRRSRFLLVEGGEELPDVAEEDPETETMPVDALTDVADLVEQEVLLGLPIAPMHDEAACDAVRALPKDESPSPFAVLEQLKDKQR